MEKRHAIFVSLAITLIIAGNYLFFFYESNEREIVNVKRVLDGDTIELEDGRKIRLLNVNTPEKKEKLSGESINFMKRLENSSVELEVGGIDKYGRTLGRIYYNGSYINLELVKLGLAHPYLVEEDELGDFIEAEEKSREDSLGIWNKSQYYGCLGVEINKKEEYVIINDKCGLDSSGWSLKDESTKTYKFENVRTREFTIYSENGKNAEDRFYWGKGKVWNDDKDSIFIRDKDGFLVYYDNYGY